jgi:MFS family permease
MLPGKRLPWYYGWNVLAVAMVFQAMTFGIGLYCFTFWVVPWTEEFSVGRGEVMMVFFTMQVVMGLAAPFAGRAVDGRSIRALVIAGALSMGAGLALAGMATSLWQILVLYGTLFVPGLLLAGPMTAQALAAKWFTRRRGLAIGISTVGTSLGGFLTPLLVTGLQAAYGWRDANLMLALIVVVAVVPLVWLFVRNSPEAAGMPGEVGEDGSPAVSAERFPVWTTTSILRTPVFWMMVLAFTPVVTAMGAIQQNLAPFAADRGFDAQATSVLVSIMALVMVGAKVFFGAMADRWDHRYLFLFAQALMAGVFVMARGEIDYGGLVIVCVLLGCAGGGMLPLLGAVVGSRFGAAAFGQVMGLLGPFTTLAAVGPWIAGYVRDASGSYDQAWIIFLFMLIPAAVGSLSLGARRAPVSSAAVG